MNLTKVNGALLIDKPVDLTSQDVVSRLKWALTNNGYCEKGFKIGHGGTLDPFATGVLAVLIGEATKLADCYLHSIKAYEGHIVLGKQTDSADCTGEIVAEAPVPELSEKEWQERARSFTTKEYFQTPPMHSAKKQNGKALYELARKGITVEREAILKKISRYDLRLLPDHELFFEAECESGTYVRVLAEDLAKEAGTLAHLRTLRRTRSSDLTIASCQALDTTLDQLAQKVPLSTLPHFLTLEKVATHIPSFSITEKTAQELKQGLQRAIQPVLQEMQAKYPDSSYGIVRLNQFPLALLERQKELNSFRLQRILNP